MPALNRNSELKYTVNQDNEKTYWVCVRYDILFEYAIVADIPKYTALCWAHDQVPELATWN